jgi:hypothetical protein
VLAKNTALANNIIDKYFLFIGLIAFMVRRLKEVPLISSLFML